MAMGVAPKFRVQKFLALLLKFWWVPFLTLVLGLGGAVAYVLLKPPTFVSKARMWEAVKLRLPEGTMFSEDVQNFLVTQTELLQSAKMWELTMARLRAGGTNSTIPIGKNGKPLPVAIHISGSGKSSVFALEATGSQAAYVQSYLDALMDSYLDYKKNIRQTVSGDTLASITEQVQKAERDLRDEQDVLTVFQRTNNLAILQEEAMVAGGYLIRLKTELSDLELEDRLLKAAAQETDRAASATNKASLDVVAFTSLPGSTPAGVTPSEHQTASQELEVLKIQKDRLSKYLRPKHPKMAKLDADIDRAEKLLEIFRRQSREQLASSQAVNRLKTENVLASIKEWDGKVVEANIQIAEAERLKINVQRAQSGYDRLALLAQNVGISRNIDQETLSILEQASAPRRSYRNEAIALVLGGVAGVGLGLGLIFVLAVRDDRFASVLEVNENLGDAVVAQVPEMPVVEGKALLLLGNGEEQHMYAESYRNLRSALLFLATDGKRPKLVLITSALPNEGKSTVAANLAHVLALGGSRVLLVDADLRIGRLHELMGLSQGPGLAELLSQPGDTDQVMQTNSMPNLHFISAGARLRKPGDLFLRPQLDQLLARWREQFDYVLIDSSPIFATDDAPTLAPKVDGTLFVVRSKFSGARQVREALELLQRRQAKILGVVFNRADPSPRSYNYYQYAEYYPEPAVKG
jgi:capsular exopolysaccharide synthesis family protein